MSTIQYPDFAKDRGPGFWLHSANLWASRRSFFRGDRSNELRYAFGEANPPSRSVSFERLLPEGRESGSGFSFIIIGDPGEGDRSQYGLLPLIRAMKADFMIVVGDLANPAGRIHAGGRNKDDYLAGFFEPYRGLDMAIWSVPGNHEYYSAGEGREYYDTFCSRKFADRWNQYGLRLVPQPGTFWELSDPDSKLTVIGIDSGKSGNLDGKRLLRSSRPDAIQTGWFEERLRIADRDKKAVIVLFHIPALSQGGKKKDAHLHGLYQTIAGHESVRYVICGHDHSFQYYDPSTFVRFLNDSMNICTNRKNPICHITNGGGGSSLHPTSFMNNSRFRPKICYPDLNQWNDYVTWGKKVTSWLGISHTLLGFTVGKIQEHTVADADAARFLSFIKVEVKGGMGDSTFSVRPVFMNDVCELYAQQEKVVNVISGDSLPDAELADRCYQDPI